MTVSGRAALVMLCALLTACGAVGARPQTAGDLAVALEGRGFLFDSRAPLALRIPHARIDEAMTLHGDGLTVEVLKITDRRTWGIFHDGAALLLITEAATDAPLPQRPDIIVRKPFVVVVREEPHPGAIRAAVIALIPQ